MSQDFESYALAAPMDGHIPADFANWLVDVPAGGRVLDVGCGDGRFLEYIRERRPDLVLVGVERSTIRAERTWAKGFKVYVGDATTMRLPASTYDLVLLIEVIEHVTHPTALLAECARVLRPDGRMILSTPNYPIKRLYDILGWLNSTRKSPADDPTHVSPFSHRGIVRLCRGYFERVTSYPSKVPGGVQKGRPRWLARRALVVCERPKA